MLFFTPTPSGLQEQCCHPPKVFFSVISSFASWCQPPTTITVATANGERNNVRIILAALSLIESQKNDFLHLRRTKRFPKRKVPM